MRPALAALPFLLLAAGAAALDVPFLSGRVTDEARLLDANTSAALEQTLKAYETRTGRQIAVLTIPSLGGESLEEFSIKVARTWKLGRKGKDDGVLILIAKDDRKVRIEVGYGLEGALPDILAGRIIREVMVPRFRGGAFAAGIQEGTSAVITALDGRSGASGPSPFRPLSLLNMADFVFILIGLGFVWTDLNEIRTTGTDLRIFIWGLLFIPIFLSPLTKVWGLAGVVIPLFGHLIGFPIGKYVMTETDWGTRYLKRRKGPHRHEAFFFGGSSGGGGGGFSGGGGSFGGGGASGSW